MTTSPVAAGTDPRAALDRHADEVARGERFEFGRNWAAS